VGTGLLCALVLTISSTSPPESVYLVRVNDAGSTVVPGYPRSRLFDPAGPWQRAWPDARECGADPEWRARGDILLVPASWLGVRGWPGLWSNAARRSRAAAATSA
jgi:hypothetical protein